MSGLRGQEALACGDPQGPQLGVILGVGVARREWHEARVSGRWQEDGIGEAVGKSRGPGPRQEQPTGAPGQHTLRPDTNL